MGGLQRLYGVNLAQRQHNHVYQEVLLQGSTQCNALEASNMNTLGKTSISPESALGLRSCVSCLHAQVCAVLRAIGPLIENWASGPQGHEAPFHIDSMAIICRQWRSIYPYAARSPAEATQL